MQEDLAAFKKTKEEEIKRLRAKKELIVYNFNLLHEATKEELAAIDQAIAKAGEAQYHAESMRTGRGPVPKAAPTPPAGTAPLQASPAPAPHASRVETTRVDGGIDVWEGGRHKVIDSSGKLVLDEEDKPDFVVEVPEHAARTKQVAVWEGAGNPEWSPADEIDERGHRHVRKGGRHRVYAQDGRLLSDDPIVNSASSGAGQGPVREAPSAPERSVIIAEGPKPNGAS